MSILAWNGVSAVPTGEHYWDGSEARPVSRSGALPWGSPSVDAMLGLDTFYWAHRGGSAIWPEMALWSYTQSAIHNVHALEVSLARTKDGVWFGLHDQTINRTSPSAPANSIASDMTWAQVQQYRIDNRQPSQPYMRLEEVCRAYGSSHVLVLDPKYGLFQAEEMFSIALSNGATTSRIIGKYGGHTANTSFVGVCGRLGITTWGYFYEQDIPGGLVPTYQEKWDLLGFNWDASQAGWDTMLAFGKPVVAHIVPTRAAADTAIAKGAAGCQTSGIVDVMGTPL